MDKKKIMRKKCIMGCKNGNSFYRFPSDERCKRIWMEKLGITSMPQKLFRVCDLHFSPSMYAHVKLRRDAIPDRGTLIAEEDVETSLSEDFIEENLEVNPSENLIENYLKTSTSEDIVGDNVESVCKSDEFGNFDESGFLEDIVEDAVETVCKSEELENFDESGFSEDQMESDVSVETDDLIEECLEEDEYDIWEDYYR